MTWFGELRRRLSALFGWLRRPGQGAAPPLSLPPTPVVSTTPPTVPAEASAVAATVGATASAAAMPAAQSVVASAAASMPAAQSVVASAAASLSAVRPEPSQVAEVAAVVATPVAEKPRLAPAPAPASVPGTLDPSLGQLKARQFFARMIAATPAGLTIDFAEWQSASVERFFMAMTSPGLTRRRESPTSGVEQLSLTNAFQGFEWD